jgi:HAMP domain-containing protein
MTEHKTSRSLYISLRVRLLLIFTLLFMVAFAAVFAWFYDFATDLAMNDLRKDLIATALAAAAAIDGDAHTELYENGVIDDETYTQISSSLRAVTHANPKAAGIYTYVQLPGEDDRVHFVVSSLLPPGVEPSPLDVAVAEQLPEGCRINSNARPELGEAYDWDAGLSPTMLNGVREPGAETELWSDEWGQWLSGYAPIYNSAGNPVGAVGVDMCAADVIALQENIQATIVPAFGASFALLAAMVFIVAHRLTRPIIALTSAADSIGQGNYDQDISRLHRGYFKDEVAKLAEVFEIMVGKVRTREEKLKQQVAELQIMVDESKKAKQVAEIVDTDFFRDLQSKANEMRARRGDRLREGVQQR